MAETEEIVDIGVDWITATATTKTSKQKLWNCGMRLMKDEHRQGNEKRVFEWRGYSGLKSGGVSVGTRDDSSIVRISGGLARAHFAEVYRCCTNVTRLDQQVTVRSDRHPQKVIADAYRRALKTSKKSKHGPQVTILKSSNGTSTVYLGARVSEKFGRVYNKGEESQLPVFDGCVRYEYEAKGDQAMLEIKHLMSSQSLDHAIHERLSWFIKARTGRHKWMLANPQTIVLHRPSRDYARSLEWLRASVSPTVRRLIVAGYAEQVRNCLSIEELDQALSWQRKRRA
jgi:hypothetical protein